jgi:UPF0755 protein
MGVALKVGLVLFCLGLLLGGGVYFLLTPVTKTPDQIAFVVKKGATIDQIGTNLKAKGLIRSPAVFKLYVMVSGLTSNIQAGSFKLSPSLSTPQIAGSLTSGRLDIWVTVVEGWRREEIAAGLATAFAETGADFDETAFLTASVGLEGQLFPDTYLFPLGSSEATLVSIMTNTLNQKLTTLAADLAKTNRSKTQILTMASLIEREARGSTDRRMVAGILWKRLDHDWPLQVDATLQYVKGYDPVQQTWWKPPLSAAKQLNSPYNTYQNPGLPPAPICSPSFDSISAAVYPTPSEYWFYLTDGQGAMHYATTTEEHNQNVQTYLR